MNAHAVVLREIQYDMDVKHICEASKDELKKYFTPIETVIFDCDGVLWHIQEPIEGTAECLATLKSLGKGLKFVSNNSVRPESSYEEMFAKIGFKLADGDLIHPVLRIVKYLKRIQFEGLIYCIGSTQFKSVLRSAGYEVIDDPQELLPESFTVACRKIMAPPPAPVKAVIVDVDFNCSHPKLARAAYFLRKPDVLFIAGATDCHLPLSKSITILGPGYFVKMLVEHTGRKPLTLSKPSRDLALEVVHDFGKNCLFIGDMLDQDMGFATECGFKKILVLSGGTTKADLERRFDWTYKPDYYADSLNDLHVALQSIK